MRAGSSKGKVYRAKQLNRTVSGGARKKPSSASPQRAPLARSKSDATGLLRGLGPARGPGAATGSPKGGGSRAKQLNRTVSGGPGKRKVSAAHRRSKSRDQVDAVVRPAAVTGAFSKEPRQAEGLSGAPTVEIPGPSRCGGPPSSCDGGVLQGVLAVEEDAGGHSARPARKEATSASAAGSQGAAADTGAAEVGLIGRRPGHVVRTDAPAPRRAELQPTLHWRRARPRYYGNQSPAVGGAHLGARLRSRRGRTRRHEPRLGPQDGDPARRRGQRLASRLLRVTRARGGAV